MSRILVTGGAGYIGSVLVPALLSAGHEVVVIDNFMYNQDSLLDCCHDRRFMIVRGDVRDKKLLAKHLEGADYIFPLACLTGFSLCDRDPIAAKTTIRDAIVDLLNLRKPDQRIIYPTTNSGYGIGQEGIHCDETTPLNPVSLYGKLKVEAEGLILEAGNSINLRLGTVFGVSPRMRMDLLVNDFVHRAVTDRFVILFEAHFNRNYIHIRDVVRTFIHCMNNFDEMRGQAYNVGLSTANLSKRGLCEEIQKQVPDFYFHEAPVGHDPDKRNYIVSNAKLEGTGFKPVYSLQDGIAELIKGYQIIKQTQYTNL